MKNKHITPEAERPIPVYSKLTPDDLERYVGKAIAVSTITGDVIGCEETITALQDLMQIQHPDGAYRILPVPDLADVEDSPE